MILGSRVDGRADAPALVLLNSVGSTSAMWDPVLAPLTEQFRVVRMDHRGHGASGAAPAGSACDIGDLAADVLETLDELRLGRVDLAGVSLGGMVGMWLAIHHPERVGRLAVVCSSAHLPPAQGWLDRAAAVRSRGMASVSEAIVGRWITPGLAARDPGLTAGLRTMFEGNDAESYAQCCTAIAAMDLRADLVRIAAPTVVIVADADAAIPPEHGRAVADAIEGARLEIVDGAGHVPSFDRPGRLAALLTDHFRAGATLARGLATRRRVLGDAHVERALADRTANTAPFQDFLTRYAWGDIWTRPGLGFRDRSVVTLAVLVALGAENELPMHVRAARRNGLSDAEIVEVIMHVAVYAGLPRANRAMSLAREILDSE